MTEDKLYVVCFYWVGDRWNPQDQGPKYVNRLYRGVARNLSLPFTFICFTNEPIAEWLDPGITVKEFAFPSVRGTGVLPRVFVFSNRTGFEPNSQVLVFDLDVIIVDSLNDMASYRGEFCVRSKFAPGQQWKADGDIFSFRPSDWMAQIFWRDLLQEYLSNTHSTGGRERYWFRYVVARHFRDGSCDRWNQLYPGQVISYKQHVRGKSGVLPYNARIVSCHGRPRPHEINQGWAKRNWR